MSLRLILIVRSFAFCPALFCSLFPCFGYHLIFYRIIRYYIVLYDLTHHLGTGKRSSLAGPGCFWWYVSFFLNIIIDVSTNDVMIHMVRCDTCSILRSSSSWLGYLHHPTHSCSTQQSIMLDQTTTTPTPTPTTMVDDGSRITDATADRFEEGATQFRKDV